MWVVTVYRKGLFGDKVIDLQRFATEWEAHEYSKDYLGTATVFVSDVGYVEGHPVEVEYEERLALAEYEAMVEEFWGVDYDPDNFDELADTMDKANVELHAKEPLPF